MKTTLKEYCLEFEKVMNKHSNFGATDTEPRFHYRNALYYMIVKDEVKVPDSANGWELFSDMTGVGKASNEMSSKLKTLVERIPNTPHGQVKEVMSWYGIEE